MATPDAVEVLDAQPKQIRLSATASTPSVLVLTERHDPDWRVYVDGQPQPLLRCNYLMRGVHLPVGQHTVEFRFEPPRQWVNVSLAGTALFPLLGVRALARQHWCGDAGARYVGMRQSGRQ